MKRIVSFIMIITFFNSCRTIKNVVAINDLKVNSRSIFDDRMSDFIKKAQPMSLYKGDHNVYPVEVEFLTDTTICF